MKKKLLSILVIALLLINIIPTALAAGSLVSGGSLSSTSVISPGSITVSLDVSNPEGVTSVVAAFSCGADTLTANMSPGGGNLWTGTILIPEGCEGTYTLTCVYVNSFDLVDGAHDCGFPPPLTFSVTKPVPEPEPVPVDITPPVVSGVYVSPSVVTVPGTVTCSITATDDLSGVRYVSACFTCGNSALNCYGTPAADGSIYATIDVPAGTPAGDYRLAALTAEDNAGNVTAYSGGVLPSALIGRKFTVKAAPAPTPVSGNTAIGISVNTAYGNLGGKFTFTAYLIDAAGRPMANRQVNFCTAYNVIGTAVTNMYGKAVFTWRPPCSGYYGVYAAFLGDYYYTGSSSFIQNIRVSNVPATADTYNLQIWLPILAVTVGFNFWLLLRKKKKQG